MRRWIWLLIGLLVMQTACSKQASPIAPPRTLEESTPSPIVVNDALGRQVILPGAPQRIVITGKALILIADAVYTFPEAPARVIALGKSSQGMDNFMPMIDPGYAEKATLEQDASAEQIAAFNPDLVILKSYLAETVGKPIEALGIPVIYLDFETPEQYTRDLVILGKVFQNESRSQELNVYYQSRVEQVRAVVQDIGSKPKVLVLYFSDRDGKVAFNVPPLTWMQTLLVEMAGGFPVWSDASPGTGWTQVSLEQVAAWDADHIFIISYTANASDVVATLQGDAQWQSLRATQDGQLHAFPGDFYSWDQPDTRWILGLTWLAGRLHPELFPDLDIMGEAQQFYQTLYRLEPAVFDQKILPVFKGDLP